MNLDAYGESVGIFHIEEERSRALMENISDIIFGSDGLGNLRDVNPSFERVIGYSPGKQEGGTFFELVHPDDWECVEDALAGVDKAQGASSIFTCRVRDRREAWRHLEITCSNLAQDPAISGWIFVARDITDQV